MSEQPPQTDLLTVEQLAEKLGASRATVDRMVQRRLIPAIRMSRKFVRYRWRDVEAALAKVTVKAL